MPFSLRSAAMVFALAVPLCLIAACSSAPRSHAHMRTDAAAPAPAVMQQNDLADSVKRLLEGTMRYQVPSTMTLDESDVVALRISANPKDADIASNFSGVSENVKFADSIRASLYGGDDFNVVARQAVEPQLLPPTGYVAWEWDVKPIHAGKHRRLTLRVDTFVRIHGRDVLYGTTKETEITVTVNPGVQLLGFVRDHLEWLWGLLAIPAGEFIRRRLARAGALVQGPYVETIAEAVSRPAGAITVEQVASSSTKE